MNKDAKIYIPGHTGLVGSAIVRELKRCGYGNLLLKTIGELDLLDSSAVADFFAVEKPQFIIQCAAKVGGIVANDTYPGQFFYENMRIQENIIHNSYLNGVKRLLFLGSSCIYPKLCPQPMKEEYLLTGELEPTNRPYALAKIGGIEMCWAYNRQYGTRYLAVMPTNLYGPGDNYDLQNSHVMPAFIRKMHTAKINDEKTVTLWGTGSPYREFLYSDDLARACVHLLNLDEAAYSKYVGHEDVAPLINIGCGEDQTIKELAELVKKVVGFEGKLEWDTTKPDGTPRKLLDVSRLFSLGWKPEVKLEEGIERAYKDFLQFFNQV
ncbi:MAG: GDP-L-fucose synthase family protein [Sedimentisphaeraceae bacterium JB056]